MERKIKFILWGSVVLYAVILSFITINRHYTFRTNAYDLGWFMQAIWTTSHGLGILYNTIEEYQVCVTTHFGIHFSPILLVLVPVYRVFPHAETLLIVQSTILAISAYLLFLLSNEVLADRKLSLGLATMYLMNSLLHGINSYDFHATPFAIPFIFLVALYFEKKEYTKVVLFSLFILLTKEDAGLALVSIGLFHLMKDVNLLSNRSYVLLFKRIIKNKLVPSERMALILGVIGGSWVLFSWKILIPHIAGIHITSAVYYHAFPCLEYVPMKVLYFTIAALTLGLLHFLRPKYAFLLTFIPWLEILLSCEVNLFRIGFQYPYMVLPLSLIAAIYALKDLQNKSVNTKKIFTIGMVIGIVFSILTTPILPLSNGIKAGLLVPPNYYQPVTSHDHLLQEVTQLIAETNLSVLTQNDIFPHLANRINTYVIWTSYCNCTLPEADIILFDNTLLYSMYNFLVQDYLVNYTKVYDHDGIEVWIKDDVLLTPEAQELIEKLEGLG